MRKIVVPLVLVLALAGVIGLFANRPHGSATSSAGRPSLRVRSQGPAQDASQANVPAPLPLAPLQSGTKAAPATGSGIATSTEALAPGVPQIGQDIVKTGDLTVQVKKGAFQDAFQSASLVAARSGGFVESSSAVNGRSGWLTIRVPADRFEVALAQLRALGTVKAQSLSGQDVTSQFVDLNARLVTWRSQEAVLLRLMSKATTIGDTLRIQNELQQVQLRIEQIQGELRVLRNQTSLATISLALREPGTPVGPVKHAPVPSLVKAWNRAVAGFLGVVSSVMVGLGYLIPLGLLGALAWVVWRRVSRRGWRPPREARCGARGNRTAHTRAVPDDTPEFAVAGYHHVLLAMPAGGQAEERAERFYGGVLGFDVIPKPEALADRGGRWFRAGPVELHLGVDDAFVAASKAHPALLVEGLDALEARLAERGIPIDRDEPLEGHERFYVRDPFGNRLELIERRPATFAGPA